MKTLFTQSKLLINLALFLSISALSLGSPAFATPPGSLFGINAFTADKQARFVSIFSDESPDAEITRLLAPDGVNGRFGNSVATEGDRIVFGAPLTRSATGLRQGAVYVFIKTGSTWSLESRIDCPELDEFMNFGSSVAISGETIFVGAPNARINGISRGAVWVFVRTGSSWRFEQKLTASDPGNSFGTSVAIKQDLALVGAADLDRTGGAYVFVRNNAVWTEETKLVDSVGPLSDRFGANVALSGNTAVVGGPYGMLQPLVRVGIVCVFVRSGTSWTLQARIAASDGSDGDQFGQDVAIEDDTLVIGSEYDIVVGTFHRGSAYIFTRNGTQWTERQRISSVDVGSGGSFGSSVGLHGDRIIIGEPRSTVLDVSSQGAGYVFVRDGGSWVFRSRLVASDGMVADFMGSDVAIQDNRFVLGAPGVDIGANFSQGAGYVFLESPSIPDLQALSDNGVSNTDNVTSLRTLGFDVAGVTPGATVELLRDGLVVDSKVAMQASINLIDGLTPADGILKYTARQVVNGEISSQSEFVNINVDNTGPVVTIEQAPGTPDPTSANSSRFQVTFNEPTFGLDVSDVTLAGSTANISNAVIEIGNSPAPNTVTVSNVVSNGQFIRVSILPGAVTDRVGNASSHSISTDNTVTIDTIAPTLTINQAASQPDPAASQPIDFTVIASEPVTINWVSLSGSTANTSGSSAVVTGSGTVFNVRVSNVISNGQYIRVSIPMGGAWDIAGNLAAPSTSTDNTVTLDSEGPRVTINKAADQLDPAMSLPVRFRVQFSEDVSGFSSDDLSYLGSSVNTIGVNAVVSGSGATYDVAVDNLIINGGTLMVSVVAGAVRDPSGNPSYVSTSSDNTVLLNLVGDPGFEQTVQPGTNPYWNSISTMFGSSLCRITYCGNGNGTGPPRSGQAWVWFDGTGQTAAEFGSATQTMTLPTGGVAFLNYYLRIGLVNAPFSSTLRVNVDGVTVQTITEPSIAESAYTRRIADISAFADGGSHTITFEYYRAAGSPSDNFTLDDISVVVPVPVAASSAIFDFDGDRKTDVSIYRPQTGQWWVTNSANGTNNAMQFGTSTDIVAPADFTGDGKFDATFWRPSTGEWFVLRSDDFSFFAFAFGSNGDLPVPADYDGDGKADGAVYRQASSTWYVARSGGGTTILQFGSVGDLPVAADYDGDGKTDIAVFRPSLGEWWIQRSSAGLIALQFGQNGDRTVAGDFTGDRKADVAIWRPATGNWTVLRSEDLSYYSFPFGTLGDVPVPGDYDGDGKIDPAVFRPSTSIWYANRSTAGTLIQQFGAAGDVPVPSAYVK